MTPHIRSYGNCAAARGPYRLAGVGPGGINAHGITSPLLGPKVCPTYRLPPGSLASRTAVGAISCGNPNRPSGSSASFACRQSSVMPAKSGVQTGPGAIALTKTPLGANSRASALVSPMTPALAAQ